MRPKCDHLPISFCLLLLTFPCAVYLLHLNCIFKKVFCQPVAELFLLKLVWWQLYKCLTSTGCYSTFVLTFWGNVCKMPAFHSSVYSLLYVCLQHLFIKLVHSVVPVEMCIDQRFDVLTCGGFICSVLTLHFLVFVEDSTQNMDHQSSMLLFGLRGMSSTSFLMPDGRWTECLWGLVCFVDDWIPA